MKLELIVLLFSALKAYSLKLVPLCQSDQLGSPPLATLFQNTTKVVGSINNVPAYTQNRKECVPSKIVKSNVIKKTSNVVRSKEVPNKVVYSSLKQYTKPTIITQQYVPATVTQQYVPATVKQKYVPATITQQYVPATVTQQYVPATPVKFVLSTNINQQTKKQVPKQKQTVPKYIQPIVNQPMYNPSPTQSNYNPTTSVKLVPVVVRPRQALVSPPVSNSPQFIPLRYLCNMNVLPPIPECLPHKLTVPFVLQEMPQRPVPQAIVPKIVQDRGIQDVDLIKVINGISLIELRRLNRTVEGIYNIVNHLSNEIEKQKAETKMIKSNLMKQAYGSVLCAENPYAQESQKPLQKICFKVVVDRKESKENMKVNQVNNSVKSTNVVDQVMYPRSIYQPIQSIQAPPIVQLTQPTQPASPSFPNCSLSNMRGPCIFIENSDLQIRPQQKTPAITISCTKKDNGGICIDTDNANRSTKQPTPIEEKIIVMTSMTVDKGNDNKNNNIDNVNSLPPQHAVLRPGYLEDQKSPVYLDSEIVNDMDRSIRLEDQPIQNEQENVNNGTVQESKDKNNLTKMKSDEVTLDESNPQRLKESKVKPKENDLTKAKSQKHRTTQFKNHSDFWNNTLGDKDDQLYSYDLPDDSQYDLNSPKNRTFDKNFYHNAHWKNVFLELTRHEPLYGDINGKTVDDEDLLKLLGKISSGNVCTGVTDRTDCLKIYSYLLMNSKSYLTSTLINSLLSQKLNKEEFTDDLNKMILNSILRNSNSASPIDTPYDSWDDLGHTGLYGSCSLGEAEVSPGRCMTIMKMSDLIRGDKYSDCRDESCSIDSPNDSGQRLSTVFLSDLLS